MHPPFSTLLSDSTFKEGGNFCPPSGAHLFAELGQELVLILCPGSADHVRSTGELEISLVALDLGLFHELANAVPRARSKLFNKLKKASVLYLMQ